MSNALKYAVLPGQVFQAAKATALFSNEPARSIFRVTWYLPLGFSWSCLVSLGSRLLVTRITIKLIFVRQTQQYTPCPKKTTSVITVQRNFRRQFEVDPPILNLCTVEKNFDLLPNFWYIKDSNITSGAQRKIFEKGTIFFGHPVFKMSVKLGTVTLRPPVKSLVSVSPRCISCSWKRIIT